METANQLEGAGQRVSPRTNVFLAAVFQGAGFSSPVKIRNMSVHGALVEAPVLPPPGSKGMLVRGSLAVSCVVMWTKENRCGVRLTSDVCVRDWLAPVGNKQQDRVDETVRLVKTGALASLAIHEPLQSPTQLPARLLVVQLASDLRTAIQLIEKVGDELAGDDATLARHGASLQLIDIALQTFSKVADHLASSDAGGMSRS